MPLAFADYIREVSRELEREYSSLTVEPFGGLYMDGLRHIAGRPEPKLLLFLGSSFGNVPIDEQLPMMKEIRARLKGSHDFETAVPENYIHLRCLLVLLEPLSYCYIW